MQREGRQAQGQPGWSVRRGQRLRCRALPHPCPPTCVGGGRGFSIAHVDQVAFVVQHTVCCVFGEGEGRKRKATGGGRQRGGDQPWPALERASSAAAAVRPMAAAAPARHGRGPALARVAAGLAAPRRLCLLPSSPAHVMRARVRPTIVSMLPSRVSPILHDTICAPAQHGRWVAGWGEVRACRAAGARRRRAQAREARRQGQGRQAGMAGRQPWQAASARRRSLPTWRNAVERGVFWMVRRSDAGNVGPVAARIHHCGVPAGEPALSRQTSQEGAPGGGLTTEQCTLQPDKRGVCAAPTDGQDGAIVVDVERKVAGVLRGEGAPLQGRQQGGACRSKGAGDLRGRGAPLRARGGAARQDGRLTGHPGRHSSEQVPHGGHEKERRGRQGRGWHVRRVSLSWGSVLGRQYAPLRGAAGACIGSRRRPHPEPWHARAPSCPQKHES